MSVQMTQSNVVVVANQFNPSIFSQVWLIKNDILSEDDFRQDCVFAPMLAQVHSQEFNLMVVPDQLQFAPRLHREKGGDLILAKVGKIVESLPHTPYVAVGLNFNWLIDPEDEGVGTFSRHLFYREDIPLYPEFDVEDARFGGYLSRDILGCRLKLDIKPVIIEQAGTEEKKELIKFAFNFHRPLCENNRVEHILDHLRRWDEAYVLAGKIISSVDGGRKT